MQCQAITRAGKQCSRQAKNNESYCSMHVKQQDKLNAAQHKAVVNSEEPLTEDERNEQRNILTFLSMMIIWFAGFIYFALHASLMTWLLWSVFAPFVALLLMPLIRIFVFSENAGRVAKSTGESGLETLIELVAGAIPFLMLLIIIGAVYYVFF